MSNDHERPSSVATEKDSYPPKGSAISQSKLDAEKGVEYGAQAEFQKAIIYVKVEDPQFASKNKVVSHVPSRQFVGTGAAPLCPRGTWKAIYWFFFLAGLAALILFTLESRYRSS